MRSQQYAGRAITGQLCTVPINGIFAEANFPLIKTRAIQLSTITIEKSLKATQINLRRATVTQRVRQRIQKTGWHEKADVRPKIFGGTQPITTPPHKPPRIDTGTHTLKSTGQKTGDATSDHIVATQTLEDRDSEDASIYTDGAGTQGNAKGGSGIIVTTGPHVTLASTVSALSRPENGARPSNPKRKLCEQPTNWYSRMSPFIRCASFQIVCQHSNAYKICIHPSKLPTRMKTRFLTLWLLSPKEGTISLSHGALAIPESAASS